MTRLTYLLLLVAPALFATTTITSIEPHQSQAIVRFTTTTGSTTCGVRASRGATLGTQIPDLLDNGATEPRTGWIINGSQHIIILGSHKANDALANNALYSVGITCSPDTEVVTTFKTLPIPWGNTAPDIVPFNAAKFGNMDHPVIDFAGTAAANTFCDPGSHSYCDPNTGVEYWPLTKAGWLNPNIVMTGQVFWAQQPIDISGTGKWTNPTQVAYNNVSSPSVFATATGGATDKLFIPFQPLGLSRRL